jgi:hypothetical protein
MSDIDRKIAVQKVMDEADGYLLRLAPKSREEADQMVEILRLYVYQKLALFELEQGITPAPEPPTE